MSVITGGAPSDLRGRYGSTCTSEDVKWSMSRDLERRYVVSAFRPDSSSVCPTGDAMNKLLSRKVDNLGDLGGIASA